MKNILLATALLFGFLNFQNLQNPVVDILTQGTSTSLRGLSAVSDNVVWASGSSGKVARSLDGGKTWKWITVPGYEKIDFRDIEAFDEQTAIIMGIASPGYILKTTDGGDNWRLVYTNTDSTLFMDAMEFVDEKNGMIIGDPIDGRLFALTTNDGGENWAIPGEKERIPLLTGEAFFAASGSNFVLFPNGNFLLASGGTICRLIENNSATELPLLLQGKETTGANAIAVYPHTPIANNRIIVGGDFNNRKESQGNCIFTTNGGKTWQLPTTPPNGYRSGVTYWNDTIVFACGLTGVDVTFNAGKDWQEISQESFHVVRKSKTGNSIYLAGSNGKIGKIKFY